MVLQLNEILDEIAALPDKQSRRERFLRHSIGDRTLFPYLRMAFLPEHKITNIPEGYPEGPHGRILIDKDIPPGMGMTTLRLELRRFQMFGPNGSAQKLDQKKREFLWARQIEGLQWQEAELITLIKDGELLARYPFLLEVIDLAGITLPDPSAPQS